MNLVLLFPLGLIALAALAIPLLVHLARRHQYAPLDFAALRWLRARVRPRQRIRFDEWPLLLVRVLLLAALALLLARPALLGGSALPTAVIAVAPGLDVSAARARQPEADWRWLAPGFPALDHPAAPGAQPLVSLLRELDQQLPAGTPLTVYVPDPLAGTDAQRAQLSRRVEWQPMPWSAPTAPRAPSPGPRLHPGGRLEPSSQQVLNALQRAWNGQPLAAVSNAAPPPGTLGVWLGSVPLPPAWQTWLTAGGTLLTTQPLAAGDADTGVLRDGTGQIVLSERRVGSGRVLRFSAVLSVPTLPLLGDADFPRQLLAVVDPLPAPHWVAAAAHAPLTGAAASQPAPREPLPWLLALVVLLFALERWLATSSRRGARA